MDCTTCGKWSPYMVEDKANETCAHPLAALHFGWSSGTILYELFDQKYCFPVNPLNGFCWSFLPKANELMTMTTAKSCHVAGFQYCTPEPLLGSKDVSSSETSGIKVNVVNSVLSHGGRRQFSLLCWKVIKNNQSVGNKKDVLIWLCSKTIFKEKHPFIITTQSKTRTVVENI